MSIFEEMLKAFFKDDKFDANMVQKLSLFKINTFIRTNCFLEILDSSVDAESKIRDAAARLDISIYNSDMKLLLFEKKNEAVQHRLDNYDRGIYIKDERMDNDGNSTVKFNNIDDVFSLMRGIVEANYRYCVAQAAKAGVHRGVSWAYLTNFNWPRDNDLSHIDEIQFKQKSTVHSYGKTFIIRELYIDALNMDGGSDICFFF
ncbi:MAG: hypothetical protein JRJ38_04810 [Deltaproteobacteria bacterium]|nr:hypothetical protein [Deltaproteobacteria bacterium]